MADDLLLLAEARDRVSALRETLEANDGSPVRLIETHVSWVLLTHRLAYKFKKPVRLPFLDLTRLAERRRCCDEELRLNRRFAPDLYLDVIEVREGPQGPCLGGSGPLVDVAVRMRRFPDGALWSERVGAGTLLPAQVDSFAGRLAALHREAPVAPPDSSFGSSTVHRGLVNGLVGAIDSWQASLPAPHPGWPRVRRWLDEELDRLESHWLARLRDGRVRECHGDLHLGNVLQAGDEAIAFDALEFAVELRWIDPLDDLAFLVMDLHANGRHDLALRLLNAYLEASGDYDGLPALRFFLVTRALVRAQVCTLLPSRGDAGGATPSAATAYLELACEIARTADRRLAITHGLPGSGKTFVAKAIAEEVGAIRVRSDVERKRLFGLSSLQSSQARGGGPIYDASATERTYARLLAVARTALLADWPTIVDAAFLRRAERTGFRALAAALDAPFTILDCRTEPALLRQRIAARQVRGDDASEADLDVLKRLAPLDEPLDDGEAALAIVCDAESSQQPATLGRRWREVGPLQRWWT
ncbi:MAG TPA: AAA family ATPase [Caldimonas sp.]